MSEVESATPPALRKPRALALREFAGGYLAVEFGGLSRGDTEGLPLVAGKMFGEKNNLADVVSVVSDLAIDGLHHGVRLGANGDGARQIFIGEQVQRVEADFPAGFPERYQSGARLRRRFQFRIAVVIPCLGIPW